MTFKQLVQEKLPAHLLGARIVGVEWLTTCDGVRVVIEGSSETVFVGGMEMLQNGIDAAHLGVPRIERPKPAPYNPREWR